MNLYIGDLHFGHKSVIKFDHRPFADVEEMDRELIRLWNDRVTEGDHVYIVGDFACRNEKPEEWYLKQLKGIKHLIIGNHDGRLLKNEAAMSYFESVDKMMHIKDNDKHICICHFPIASWNGFFKGHLHIYGHLHNDGDMALNYMLQFEKALNASACNNHYVPVSLKELVENNKKLRIARGIETLPCVQNY